MTRKQNEILERAVQVYFEGGDWRGYIKQEVKDRQYNKKLFADIFRRWRSKKCMLR